MRRLLHSLCLVSPLLAPLGCPTPNPAVPDAGSPPADAGAADDGGTVVDAGSDVDAGATPDAGVVVDAGPPNGSAIWSKELPNPYLLPGPDDEDGELGDIAFDFFLQYTVTLPEPNEPTARLVKTLCIELASWDEPECTSTTEAAVAGGGGVRWGLDPSAWESGLNIYEHILTLKQGDDVLYEDVLRFEVTAP